MLSFFVTLGLLCCVNHLHAVSTSSYDAPLRLRVNKQEEAKATKITHHRHLNSQTLTVEQIDDAIAKAKSLLSLIYSRYEYDTPRGKLFVTMQSNMNEKDFDLLKLIFQKKITTAVNPKYKMVFGGSSVTAGHDNLFHHSYPLVLESRMRPIFDALGIEFEVNNIAQGANDCHPSNLCYDAMAGEGGDFYLWEQSFNCGREYGFVEMIVRQAARNEASVYIMSSGGVDTKKCAPSKEEKPLRSDSEWKPSQPIQLSDDNVTKFMAELINVNRLGQSMGGSAVSLMKHYIVVPPASGMNVWFSYPKSLCRDVPGLKNCDVPSLMEGCIDLKFLSRETSVYSLGGGAGHHPSRAMHMMRAELISWSYTIALLEAMFSVRQELVAKKSMTVLNQGYALSLSEKFSTIPDPVLCGKAPYFCKNGYSCATDYSPKYTKKFFLRDLVVKTTVPSKWKYNVHPIEKRQSDRVELHEKEMRNYYGTREGPKAGEIFFRVNVVSPLDGHVALCWEGLEKGPTMSRLEYRLELNVGEKALSPDFIYTPEPNRSAWESKNFMNHCMTLNNLPMGVHVLGLESKGGGNVGVSHLITWKP